MSVGALHTFSCCLASSTTKHSDGLLLRLDRKLQQMELLAPLTGLKGTHGSPMDGLTGSATQSLAAPFLSASVSPEHKGGGTLWHRSLPVLRSGSGRPACVMVLRTPMQEGTSRTWRPDGPLLELPQ